MNFDKNQFYIRTTDVERTIVSGEKQLEGLFNRPIGRRYFDIQKGGPNFWNLYSINKEDRQDLDKYSNYCKNKRSLVDYNQIFKKEIYPILQDCYGIESSPSLHEFCDSVYTAYFEYNFGNNTDNKIGKCGSENATKMNDFCYNWFNTFRGWDEYAAYMFYMLYQHMFNYMHQVIKGTGSVKMVMFGGHDITVDRFMNFLSGLKIIPRTYYPHYACNIVAELRKYGEFFFLEFYYNDILKFNDTLEIFQSLLENTKYSNLYNFCGIPPWIKINDINNEYNQTKIKIQNDLNNMKIPNRIFANLKIKLKKFFNQDKDKDLFITLGTIIFGVLMLVVIIILLIILYFKRRKRFTKLVEESQKNVSNQINLSESEK